MLPNHSNRKILILFKIIVHHTYPACIQAILCRKKRLTIAQGLLAQLRSGKKHWKNCLSQNLKTFVADSKSCQKNKLFQQFKYSHHCLIDLPKELEFIYELGGHRYLAIIEHFSRHLEFETIVTLLQLSALKSSI